MSTPFYTTMPPPPRRHPLATAANHYAVNVPRIPPQPAPRPPPKQQVQPPKEPSSPPLPRQNAKVTPPSPPQVITDSSGSLAFKREGLLGEGGFARVYEVRDSRGRRSACKVVTKSSLKNKKAKIKLYAEIKIHKSLDHPNIVLFEECFEDEENVYMTLELCHNGSLMDMLRRRRRFTEPEARYFMVQLIGACQYMHNHQVIHRDLKLGNIFLDRNMNVKVGDFGLAALIETPGERKKTICGTPNYIAPEVLFDNVNGHSFEVDTWSIGVILYTLVVGRPPFQTKDVKAIYKRIRDNDYEFPTDRAVSTLVRELIQSILTPDPSERPTLHDIVNHDWFTTGTVPGYIPISAHDSPPDFRHIQRHMSQANLARLRRYALLDEDQVTTIALPSPPAASNGQGKMRAVSSSLAQQEKEFQKAVQPGSPISALLSSARQPLIIAQPAQPGVRSEQPLLRKLQAAKEAAVKTPARAGARGLQGLQGIAEEREDEYGARVEEIRKKELESQKARIVAQMVPVPGSAPGSVFGGDDVEGEVENIPPSRTRDAARLLKEKEKQRVEKERAEKERAEKERAEKERAEKERMKERERERDRMQAPTHVPERLQAQLHVQENATDKMPMSAPSKGMGTSIPSDRDDDLPLPAGLPLRTNAYDIAAQTLTAAFEAKAIGRLFRDPREDADLPPARVFIACWVDYCNKYGMGYVMTDGSVGVYFNDSTSMMLSADKQHFDYIESRRQGAVYVRKNYIVADYPDELKSKVYLLKHFERYLFDRLYRECDYVYEDVERTKGMDFVHKYLRIPQVTLFKLSHDVLQFNFHDHSKLILSSGGLHVTHIDKYYQLTRHTLSEIMANALRPERMERFAGFGGNQELVRLNTKLVDKLKFCKEVLLSIRTASQNLATGELGDNLNGNGSDNGAAAPALALALAPVAAPASVSVAAPAPAPAPVAAPAPAPLPVAAPARAPAQARAYAPIPGPSRIHANMRGNPTYGSGLLPSRSVASFATKSRFR